MNESGKKIIPDNNLINDKRVDVEESVKEIAGKATVKGNFGIIDYDKTKKNLDLVISEYGKYKVFIDEQYKYENEINQLKIEKAKEGTKEYAAAIKAKEVADAEYMNKSIQVDNAILKSKQEKGALLGDAMESSVKAVTDYAEKLTSSISCNS